MVSHEELAKKVYDIIIEKKPMNLSVTFYDGKWRIYTDEGLVAEIGEEARVKIEDEEKSQETLEDEKARVKKEKRKKSR